MSQPLSDNSLKELDFLTFQNVTSPFLDKIVAENPPPAGETLDKDKAISDMFDLVHGQYDIPWSDSSGSRSVSTAGRSVAISECTSKEIIVAIDCFTVFFQFLGITGKVCGEAATEVVNGLTRTQLDGLSSLFQAISNAEGALNTATAIFNLISAIYKLTGIRQILGAIEDNMAWYNWVLMATVITAQAVALLATDGAAFIGELVLMGAFLTQLGIDASSMADACGWSS
ncbi:hypothetical protein ACRPHP_00200 [Pantoea allii]|uniref:hypothetical protein n=1 Tax=Pantoea allii TaxID=574096 RepID=UPI003D78E262